MVPRFLLVTCALAVATWLALSYVSERRESRAFGVALTPGQVPAERIAEAQRLARQARAWQPDTLPKMVEWRLAYRQRRFGRADAVLRDVLDSEPMNADVWGYLAQTTRDPESAREARRRLQALRPR